MDNTIDIIKYDSTNKEEVRILSSYHLSCISPISIVDILLSICTTLDLNNRSIELEESIVCTNKYMYIITNSVPCHAFNISMNKIQLVYMLKKWSVYNIDMIDIDDISTIEELIQSIEISSTIEEIISKSQLTRLVLG